MMTALALTTLTLSACSTTAQKPLAYRATAAQLIATISEVAPGLPHKALNEAFRVTRQTETEIVIATPLTVAGRVAGFFVSGFGPDASITFHLKPDGNITYLDYTANANLTDQAAQVMNTLDKTYERVSF